MWSASGLNALIVLDIQVVIVCAWGCSCCIGQTKVALSQRKDVLSKMDYLCQGGDVLHGVYSQRPCACIGCREDFQLDFETVPSLLLLWPRKHGNQDFKLVDCLSGTISRLSSPKKGRKLPRRGSLCSASKLSCTVSPSESGAVAATQKVIQHLASTKADPWPWFR